MVVHESLETKITATCDVLVCGGGFAGIAAALAAARLGKKVILLEKQYMLGGLGTAAAITDDFGALDVRVLQEILQNNGVVLHEKDLKEQKL